MGRKDCARFAYLLTYLLAYFSVLSVLVGVSEEHPTRENTVPIICKVSLSSMFSGKFLFVMCMYSVLVPSAMRRLSSPYFALVDNLDQQLIVAW